MQLQEFTRQLAAEAYSDVLTKELPAGPEVAAHSHPFDVMAMVLEGEITLGVAGKRTTYRTGEVFTMVAGCEHTEQCGDEGVRYLVGRRHH